MIIHNTDNTDPGIVDRVQQHSRHGTSAGTRGAKGKRRSKRSRDGHNRPGIGENNSKKPARQEPQVARRRKKSEVWHQEELYTSF